MALTPSPPVGSRAGPPISRGAPHVVKLRHPAPVPLELLELRVETAESRERASLVLLEDNAWMQLVLSQWNDVVSIDPNVAWAEEGAREVILRHQDRDWSMFCRAFHAQYRLAEERYRERIEAGAIALEEEHRELAQNLEKEEGQDLADILKWEKVHRPWFMQSLTSPKRKRGPGMAGSGSATEPTKPNTLSFAFRGRQQWMKEKQMLFERITHQNRFMKMEEAEELARGAVEADEALVFMRIQQDHLEQRYVAHKRYLRRLKDIEDGVADSNLSEASIHRRQTDAALKIQRQGRYYVAQKERERRQAEVAAKILEEEKKDEAARKIQRMGRAHTSKVELERRRAAAADHNEKRVEEEPFQPSKEEESAPQGQSPSDNATQAADASSEQKPTRRDSKMSKTVAAPWDVEGAVKGYTNLQLLSRAVQDGGLHGRLHHLNPLWKSLGYRFDTTPQADADSDQGQGGGSALGKRVSSVKSAAHVVKANMRLSGQPTKGYEMLDLLASTVNTLPATSKVGLLAVVDGLFSGCDTRGAVLANGTYPYLEELLRQGKASGLLVESPTTATAEVVPAAPAWVPTRSISKADLEKYWDIASHHHHVANAIELTPPRWKDYVTPEELEAEERLEMENGEMLRREHLVEAQLLEAYGLISMFYMMTKAREPSVDA